MEILNFIDLIRIVWQNRKTLVKIAIATTVISAALSFLLPVYYKSTTSMFPARSSQVPVTETAIRKGPFSEFGETSESEQSLEIINSTRLLDKVIAEFNLFNHYEIDSSENFAYTRVLNTLRDNMSSKRNKYNSIEINVIDKDPIMASNIANSITTFYDSVKFELSRARMTALLDNLTKNYHTQKIVVDSLKMIMDSLTENGVMSQFQRGYLIEAFSHAKGQDGQQIKKLVDVNISRGETFDYIERVYEAEVGNLMHIKKFMVQAKADIEVEFTQKFVVDKAIPAEQKTSPVRWLFVLVSTFSSIFFAIAAILINRKWPAIKSMLQD
ncbi:MAG: hypothetical protein HOP11_05320 [Saprospiraceae bacterium]|nr:hypothetical protein [Saprospiraceae bacterium]